ncbi:copper resistance protein CopC/CopD [Jatrophihabitans telluris]|uniref:Copper resistance protein CopC/CopD n=1 Tax=Jatrophihabitans telluris TaxID=2038343 RepID=A0ABY4R2X6_9ACTN|nr:copper resistance protein CopC [Jatrophihabitans telluris]UQX89521.1 copper resistance protein CopC/CopD [Jatrophihabitans telluris]
MAGVLPNRGLLCAALVAGLFLLMVAAAPGAFAHAVLESSDPAPGSVIAPGRPQATIELGFDEPVEVSLGAIQVVAGDGKRVDEGTVEHPAGAANRVSVRLRPGLAEGSYLVLWRVVSADSHPVHGSFTFALGHPGTVASTAPGGSPRALTVALGSARFIGYAALLLLVGAIVFVVVCLPGLWTNRRLKVLCWAVVSAAGIATAAGLALQAAVDIGGGWSASVDPVAVRAISATRLGHAHLIRLVMLLLLGLALIRTRALAKRERAALLTAGLAIMATVASEGHAGQRNYTIAIDLIHLMAAAAWLGGLVVLVLIVLPQLRRPAGAKAGPAALAQSPALADRLADAARSGPATAPPVVVLERSAPTWANSPSSPFWSPVHRFSWLAVISVALLSVTGVVQALRQVSEWGALMGTAYGRLLLVKIGLVAAALVVAALSTSVLHARPGLLDSRRRAARLGRTVALETAILLAAVAITSDLVSSTPASVAYRPVQDRTIKAGPVTVEVTAVDGGARALELHIYTYGPDGALAEVQQLRGEARRTQARNGSASGTDSGPVTIPLIQAGTGHFIANRLLLPATGSWTITLVVQTGEFDAYTTTTTLTVR